MRVAAVRKESMCYVAAVVREKGGIVDLVYSRSQLLGEREE